MNWKRPVNNLEFAGPGAILLAFSGGAVIASIVTAQSIASLITDFYLYAGAVGIVISMFIFSHSKLGTILFFALTIPFGYHVYWFIATYGLRASIIQSIFIFVLVMIAGGLGQIRYHAMQQKLAEQARYGDAEEAV